MKVRVTNISLENGHVRAGCLGDDFENLERGKRRVVIIYRYPGRRGNLFPDGRSVLRKM